MKLIILVSFCFLFLEEIGAQSVLSIRSTPDSANVFIDDSLYGKTPFEIINIKGGYKAISLEKDSLIWQTMIYLKPDSSDQIYAILKGDYGLLTLFTNPPEAEVFLNDSLIGKTPLNEYKLKIGLYNLEIRKENYLRREQFIDINSRLHKMNIDLISLFGSISFNNISSGQNIYLDGKLLNNDNIKNYQLPIGNHKIRLIDNQLNKEVFDNIDVESDNHYDVFYNYDEFSFTPVLFSAVIPGLGQIYNKSYLKGTIILASAIAGGYLAVSSINNHNKKLDEYNSYQTKYLSAETEEDAIYYRSMTQNAYNKENSASRFKNFAIGTLVGIYLYNLVDAILFSSKFDVMHFYEQESQYKIKTKIDFNKKVNVGLQWNF